MAGGLASRSVIGVGAILTLVYVLAPGQHIAVGIVATIGIGTLVLQLLGLRRHRPADPRPWILFVLVSIAWLTGIVLRPWAAQQVGPRALTADVFTVTGYLLAICAFVLLLRRCGARRPSGFDAAVVTIGAALTGFAFLSMPAALVPDRSPLISILAMLYPLWDVLLLLLVLNLASTTAVRLRSFRYLACATTCLLVGDLGYAIIGASGQLVGSHLLDAPLLLGFTYLAATVTDPSLAGMSAIEADEEQSWPAERLVLTVAATITPVLAILSPRLDIWRTLALAATTTILIGALVYRIVSAVTGAARLRRDLDFQVSHDPLTRFPTRELFLHRVESMLNGTHHEVPGMPEEVWVATVKVDGVLMVNDHWGHETGDQLLRETGRRLVAGTRGAAVVGRGTGYEFVVAGFGAAEHAMAMAQRLQRALEPPVPVAGHKFNVRAWIGVAVSGSSAGPQANGIHPGAGTKGEQLLRDTGLALARARSAGNGRTMLFTDGMRSTAWRRLEMERALREAQQRAELWLSYQPIVDLSTGQVSGAEVLLRWTQADWGPVSPSAFIPLAEKAGLIEDLGGYVIEEAMRQLAWWQERGQLPEAFYLAVNVSTRQLHDHALCDVIENGLQRYGLSPDRLHLEITESSLLEGDTRVAGVLERLRSLGLGLSVDDFGTGYSSLSYLSRFPVTAVKIDRAFMAGLSGDGAEPALVQAIVAMAHALRLSVVAEGVETPAQEDALRDLGVRSGQGWLWGKAVADVEFADRFLAVDGRSPSPAGQPA